MKKTFFMLSILIFSSFAVALNNEDVWKEETPIKIVPGDKTPDSGAPHSSKLNSGTGSHNSYSDWKKEMKHTIEFCSEKAKNNGYINVIKKQKCLETFYLNYLGWQKETWKCNSTWCFVTKLKQESKEKDREGANAAGGSGGSGGGGVLLLN